MKNFSSAALLLAFLTASSPGQLPGDATLDLAINPAANTAKLTIGDAGNHSFLIQSSPDFIVWTDVETLKIYNGHFNRELPINRTSNPKLFWQAVYDSNSQLAGGSVAQATVLPATTADYTLPLPARFLAPVITAQDTTPVTNPTTDTGSTLGRVLFYDKRLSLNQTISCSSCHIAEHGFSDPAKFSVGFQGGLTGRNSMGLTNARWYQRRAFFWDERAATLEDQVLRPIQDTTEMGMTLPALVTRLSAEPFYATLFTNAFGSSTVTSDRISRALAQFVRSIVSTDTKFDRVNSGTANFTQQEAQGRDIYNGPASCNICHGTDNFLAANNTINNNGLENPYIDKGLGAISGLPQQEGLFKVPSLRNIELTAPYMHDGRFATLEEVVDFYDADVVDHPNLSPPLRIANGPNAGQPRRLNLSLTQKAALVAFLKTFTDTSVTTDVRFSDPFNYGD